MLDTFVAIVRNVPHVARSSEPRPADAERTLLCMGGALCFVLLVLGMPGYFFAAGARCDFEANPGATVLLSLDGCFTPIPLGLSAGLIVGLAVAPVLSRRIRGRSNSHERASYAYAILMILSIHVALALSAAFLWSL
ncbi:hypothetical protein WMF37_49435 [Sorangium sp. So ce291]|uniref:hypothetical protein n=1 Tax=Sorangium sp. So ce291 TaxID=3133294 RepID=UPI003F61C098